MERLADGIHRWPARHPEWHPGKWGAEVACFALTDGRRTFLIDPLVDKDLGWEELDGVVSGDVVILITIPVHVRNAAAAADRYGAQIWGHAACTKRLGDAAPFRELGPGSEPAGVRAFAIGKPQRQEMPLLIEAHGAMAFGDVVVGVPGRDGPIRVWMWTDFTEDWYRGRFVPTLEPLAAAAPEHLLVTHGPPVVGNGAKELQRALTRKAWYHHG
ncbi:MAG: hypothetical protein QOF68_1385 [Gaiellales bacterium]|nr:hypothetical protein [Gaiellales bacterium]